MHKTLILFCMLLFVTPAMAKDKNKEHSPGDTSHPGKSQHTQSLPRESDQYRHSSIQNIIDSYYREQFPAKENKKSGKKKKNLPPGLQKKLARGGNLPPGWQKKVTRGEVLDWQLYRRSVKLPQAVCTGVQTKCMAYLPPAHIFTHRSNVCFSSLY